MANNEAKVPFDAIEAVYSGQTQQYILNWQPDIDINAHLLARESRDSAFICALLLHDAELEGDGWIYCQLGEGSNH